VRVFLHGVSILGLVAAVGCVLLGVAAWPPGGLMFALPYVFFMLGGVVGVASTLLFVFTRAARRPSTAGGSQDRGA